MNPPSCTRRDFLGTLSTGLGGIALASLMPRSAFAATPPHYAPKAKYVIQLFMTGGASQCDLFDYKPKLIQKHGEAFDPGGKVELFQSSPENVMRSPWGWKQHGASGKWMSDLVPHLATCVDDMSFIPG